MIKICYGCGCKLQSENSEKEGFIPENKINNSVYCQRCFRIMHYGGDSISSVPKDIDTIISLINNDHRFVIFLVDFLSLNSTLMQLFKRLTSNKLLVVSKCDIIPKSIKESTIKNYIHDYYKITSDIKLISSYNNFGITSLMNYLNERNIHETYIVGLSNSGKSTFINKLIEVNNSNMHEITTSYIPNTTLDFIRININENLLVIDSPGFIIPSINTMNIIKKNNLKSFIKPKTFQMKKDEVLEIEDMYIKVSDNTSLTLYMSNDLNVKKYFKPIDFNLKVSIPTNSDLVINGLGFINIKTGTDIMIANIKKDYLEVRKSVFGDNHE